MKADGDPNLVVYFNGQYMPLGEARVGILTHALHYGTGVFEGIRAHWDEGREELFALRPLEHYERWKRNCGILRIFVPHSAEELCAITVELLRRNAFRTNVSVSYTHLCDAFCDDNAFTVEETRTVLTAARQHGLGLRVHAEQFRPGTGAALAAELGAATADHLETATAETLGQLRTAGVQPVLLPGSVFALGRTAYPPARTMVELGLAIVLATDFNPGSSPIASMPFMLSLACLEMGLTPAEALTAATINAAWSLDLGNRTGSLETGKQADLLIHEFTDYRELAYFIAAPARPRVLIAGREVTP